MFVEVLHNEYQQFNNQLLPDNLPGKLLDVNIAAAMHSFDYSTELLNEIETTKMAIGDATAEVMSTTMGQIPNIMYDIEDTPPTIIAATANSSSQVTTTYNWQNLTANASMKPNPAHTMIFLFLFITFTIIILFCCITACVIANSKRRLYFRKSDFQCENGCEGIHQPLLMTDKNMSSLSKNSNNSSKH